MELFEELNEDLVNFIKDQKVFFVATAVSEGTINLSPKGLDSLRVVENNRIFSLFVGFSLFFLRFLQGKDFQK